MLDRNNFLMDESNVDHLGPLRIVFFKMAFNRLTDIRNQFIPRIRKCEDAMAKRPGVVDAVFVLLDLEDDFVATILHV